MKLPPKAQEESDSSAPSAAALKKALKHTSETFAVFEKLNIPRAPMCVADLIPLQRELENKLASLKAKAEEWESERKAKVELAKERAEKGEVEEVKEEVKA